MKNVGKKQIITMGIAVLAVLIVGVVLIVSMPKTQDTEVLTKTSLEKIVNISELSTYETAYNGIAVVYNEKNSEKVDYYVSYEATVKAGVDVEQIQYDIDESNKILIVDLPEVTITDTTVKMTSLDYIFMNDKANTETVSEQAYKECIKDVQMESAQQETIKQLAKENAKNIVKALVEPFVNQLDEEYTLEIR